MLSITSRNDVLDLTIQLYQPSLAIAAESVLKACQLFDDLPIGKSSCMTAKSVPARVFPFDFEILRETGRSIGQPPNALHVDLPI